MRDVPATRTPGAPAPWARAFSNRLPITRASASLPFLFTGSLLLESFFGIPGLGFTGVDALYNSDLQLLKALVITSALLFVIMNLLADLAYAWADPRIRLE